MQETNWLSQTNGNFLPQNAQGVIIMERIDHSSPRSLESNPIPKEKKSFRWTRKPLFPYSIALLCAFKAHHCHSKLSNLSLAC